MKKSWKPFLRRLAAGCAVSGTMAWSSAMCYAVQLAYDIATNPAYQENDMNGGNDANPANNTNGWAEGDNGGTGFEPWNFDTDYLPPGGEAAQHAMDGAPGTTSPFNNLGRAWTLRNFQTQSGDVARAGRGFDPLQVGQTLRVVIDNPTEEFYFRGYFVNLNSRNGEEGGGNICYGNSACTPGTSPVPKLGVNIFEFSNPPGDWGVSDGGTNYTEGGYPTGLFNKDNVSPPRVGTNSGVEIEVELTAADKYILTMTPLDNPGAAFTSAERTFMNPGQPVDWLGFTFFNTAHDVAYDTDFFIREIEIIGPDEPVGEPGDFNNDDKVNAADYITWRLNTGNAALPNDGGATTQAARFTLWKSNFGNMAMMGSGGVDGGGAVPEPGTFVYLVTAAAGAAVGLRRRR